MNITKSAISELLQAQKAFFSTGATTHYLNGVMTRTNALADLQEVLKRNEQELLQALHEDLGKSEYEAYTTEFLPIYQELEQSFKKGAVWMKPKSLMPSKLTMHGSAKTQYAPKGSVLIISPWNYPLQLAIMPLISALLAGNTCILKPSEYAPHVSAVLEKIINGVFDEKYVHVVTGGADVAQMLINEPFDHIFFTGSPAVGKEVMAAAAKNLASVTLELGGKSPCIVTPTANIYKSARNIAWAKMMNAGQTCIAPDYVLVCEEHKEAFVSSLVFAIREMYGQEPLQSADYGKIINKKHFDRLNAYIEPHRNSKRLLFGGQTDEKNLRIAPTIVTDIQLNDPLMNEEIFGPILPVLTYDKTSSAIHFINSKPAPLACYLFTETDDVINMVDSKVRCGGLCINDTIAQMLHPGMPFGGVGGSGFGRYHGEAGFVEFSNQKAVFKSHGSPNALRYPPYTDSKLAKLKQTFKLDALGKGKSGKK